MHSPPYPNAHLFIHPAWHLQCTGPQWAGRRIKAFTSMYKSVHTGSMKGRVIAITQKWGFDQRCLNLVQYLHKNLRLVKEKFQY